MSTTPEQALYQASRHLQGVRAVAFLMGETEGRGPSEWEGQPVEDLAALLDVLAQGGLDHAQAGLEALSGAKVGNHLPA